MLASDANDTGENKTTKIELCSILQVLLTLEHWIHILDKIFKIESLMLLHDQH